MEKLLIILGKALVRAVLKLLAASFFVYVVVYVTPASVAGTFIGGNDALIDRRDVSGRSGEQYVGKDLQTSRAKRLQAGDCITRITEPVQVKYSQQFDLTFDLAPGQEHCIGSFATLPRAYMTWMTALWTGNLEISEFFFDHTLKSYGLVAGSLLVAAVVAFCFALANIAWPASVALRQFTRAVEFLSSSHVIVLCFVVIVIGLAKPNSGFSLWMIAVLALGNGLLNDFSAVLRQCLLRGLDSDYAEAARSRGASALRHAWRNEIAIGMMDATVSQIPILIGGTIVVEYVFGFPGIGKDIVDAVAKRDVSMIMAVTVVVATTMIVCAELVGFSRRHLDPKLTKG